MLPFWKTKPLDQLSREEWESLCDGCARCCLIKLQDEDTDEIFYTDVVCRYLDQAHCQCTVYENRTALVPTCLTLAPGMIENLHWAPSTCAYRLLAQGKDLPDWHPLVSGSRESVHRAGISVRRLAVSEDRVDPDDLIDHVVEWIE